MAFTLTEKSAEDTARMEELKTALLKFVVRVSQGRATKVESQALPAVAKVLAELL